MSKRNKLNLNTDIISQINKGELKMKPKWYFFVGSIAMFSGLVGLLMGTIFLINLSIFFFTRNGPMMSWRIQAILSTFPWWIPIIAFFGIILAIWLLKKYDFSYKKNFLLLIVTFVVSILLAGFLFDKLGLNEYLSRGRMRKFYQNIEVDRGRGGTVKGLYRLNR